VSNDNDQSMIIARPSDGIARNGFGSSELERRRETQSTALAERAKAEVQARFIMAMQRPRDIDEVRVRLLKHCKRKGFAERAEYAKPVGGQKIVGPSIRFVECALQEYGNVIPEATVVYEDDEKRVIRVSVCDLERNLTWHDDALVEKFVERRNPKDAEVVGSRTNSRGETVYKVRATEDDLANKQAAAVSKKLRNLGLRILPADLVDEAIATCQHTRRSEVAKDPDAVRRQVADAFSTLGVMPAALHEYLGTPIEQASPGDIDELRIVHASIKEGERWADLLEAKRAERGEVEKPSKRANDAADRVKAKLEAKRAKKTETMTDAEVVEEAGTAPSSLRDKVSRAANGGEQ
jgi:hypothetical protein